MGSYQKLLDTIATSNTGVDQPLLRKAYTFAAASYQGQKLYTGEPYISFPLAVAILLAELELDETTLAAALLYDTVRGGNSIQEIHERFGQEVAAIVEGVIRIEKARFECEEPIRILAACRDYRALAIQIADRLHTMRTLITRGPEKQKRIARDVMRNFVPLAESLGLRRIAREMEAYALHYSRFDEICRNEDPGKDRAPSVDSPTSQVAPYFDQSGDGIFVFPLGGPPVFLAKDATPLEFSRQVEPEPEGRCVGAKINGRVTPLDAQLHNGDTVEVFYSRKPG